MLAPAGKQKQWNTNNRGTYRYSVLRGTTDTSIHQTASDNWPASARRLTQTHLGAAVQEIGNKISIPLRWPKIGLSSGSGEERRTPRATSRPIDHGRMHGISSRPSSSFTMALPETTWVGWGLSLCRDPRPIVAWAIFGQLVDFSQSESTSSTASSIANFCFANTIALPFSPYVAAVREYLQPTSFWNSLEKNSNIALPLSSVLVSALS